MWLLKLRCWPQILLTPLEFFWKRRWFPPWILCHHHQWHLRLFAQIFAVPKEPGLKSTTMALASTSPAISLKAMCVGSLKTKKLRSSADSNSTTKPCVAPAWELGKPNQHVRAQRGVAEAMAPFIPAFLQDCCPARPRLISHTVCLLWGTYISP